MDPYHYKIAFFLKKNTIAIYLTERMLLQFVLYLKSTPQRPLDQRAGQCNFLTPKVPVLHLFSPLADTWALSSTSRHPSLPRAPDKDSPDDERTREKDNARDLRPAQVGHGPLTSMAKRPGTLSVMIGRPGATGSGHASVLPAVGEARRGKCFCAFSRP